MLKGVVVRQTKTIRVGGRNLNVPAQTEIQVYSVRQFEDWIENKDGSPFNALRLEYEIIHDPRKGAAKPKKEEVVEDESPIESSVVYTEESEESGDESAPKKAGRKPKNQ